MVIIARLLAVSAEHSLENHESKHEKKSSHGPKVSASKHSLEDVTEFRHQELQNLSFDDFNAHSTVHSGPKKFDVERLSSEMSSQSTYEITKDDQKKVTAKFFQIIGSFLLGSVSLSAIALSKTIHNEKKHLEKLNDIYHNPKARVALGEEHAKKVVKKIRKHLRKDEEQVDKREEVALVKI